MSDKKKAKEGNYFVRQAESAQKSWETTQKTLKSMKKKSEGEHSIYED